MATSSMPPFWAVIVFFVLHVDPSVDVWILYSDAYATSQFSLTREMVALPPRSTAIHSGSWPSRLAQRVVELPSTALAPPKVAASTDDTVVGLLAESRTSAALAVPDAARGGITSANTATTTPVLVCFLITSSSWARAAARSIGKEAFLLISEASCGPGHRSTAELTVERVTDRSSTGRTEQSSPVTH